MKRIIVGIMVAAIGGLFVLSHVGAWDGEKCEKEKRTEKKEWRWHGWDFDCPHEWFELDLRGLEEGLEELEALEALAEWEGLEGLPGLEALEALEGLEALEDIDIEIDLEGLTECLRDVEIMLDDIHIPPTPPMALPLPLPVAPIPDLDVDCLPHFCWEWDGWSVWNDSEDLTEEEELRLHAFSALGRLDAEEAIPILDRALRKEDPPAIRCKALSILRKINDERVVPILGEVARTDPDYRVRKRAIHYLGRSGDRRALEILQEILEE